MMRSIISPRVAALALAVPLFITAPALGDPAPEKVKKGKRSQSIIGDEHHSDRSHRQYRPNAQYRSHGRYVTDSYSGYGQTYWGQSYREAERLQRQAVRACRRAIRDEAYYRGFRDVDFERGRRVEQIGPRGFRVTFREVEFEGRRRDFDRRVSCTVRRGDLVRQIDGIPRPGRRGNAYRSGYYR